VPLKSGFPPLEEKMVGKIPAWNGKLAKLARCTALVKYVLASQSIYHFTSLNVPTASMHNMKKIRELSYGRVPTRFPAANARSIVILSVDLKASVA
jgi:hypothetical protein